MRVVYLDTLFLLNFSVDYLLLLLTARIGGIYCRRRRLLAGALVGAVLAVLLFFPVLPVWLSLPVRAGCGFVTVLTAFGSQPSGRWPRLCGIFLLSTLVLAGLLMAMPQVSRQNGSIYYEVSSAVMLVGFTAIFALSGLVFGRGRANAARAWREIQVKNGGQTVRFRALCDSGNLLRDPVNGRAVIVAEAAALAPLFGLPQEELSAILGEQAPETRLSRLRRCLQTPVWLLPVRTVAQTGLLPVFSPQKLLVDGKPHTGYLLGITSQPLKIGGDCRALMGV